MKSSRSINRSILLFALLSFILVGTTNGYTNSRSWEEAIAAVKIKRDKLYELRKKYATEEKSGLLGSAYALYNSHEHQCAILGRMLGKEKIITHLEEEVDDTSQDAELLAIGAVSLDNWISQAEYLIGEPVEVKIRLWNSDCAGKLEIPISERIKDESADAFFRVPSSSEGKILHILGPVTSGFSSRLKNALDQNPQVEIIALGSIGGDVREAILAGIEIRKRGLETTLWQGCYSACPLVLLGGTSRTSWAPYYELGFHQVSRMDGTPVPFNDDVYRALSLYISAMGADPELVLKLMKSSPPLGMTVITYDDILCSSGIMTWVQRGCTASGN